MEVWFWISLTSLIYVYFGYLGFLKLISIVKKVRTCDTAVYNDCLPIVSVIVAAYNEEKSIGRRVKNLLEQDYPKDKLEIIVASDGSTDRTVKIAKQFEKYGVKIGVKILDFKQNRGRAAVQNDGVKEAKGEIIIFTDAET
ncbi:glycosyltransferase, partial [Candidatus Sumerlaeota bacterium]|nr:glycosyltransferase [Candidatus Sumerlaeota bacterium]